MPVSLQLIYIKCCTVRIDLQEGTRGVPLGRVYLPLYAALNYLYFQEHGMGQLSHLLGTLHAVYICASTYVGWCTHTHTHTHTHTQTHIHTR